MQQPSLISPFVFAEMIRCVVSLVDNSINFCKTIKISTDADCPPSHLSVFQAYVAVLDHGSATLTPK
eukprot:m.221066 g.221066  ORF g.221066 m.221066 type:complete len:67 (-) comp19179_c0_seq4:180-380(-)